MLPSPAQVYIAEFSTSCFWIAVGCVSSFVNYLSYFSNYDHFLQVFSSQVHALYFYGILAWLSQVLLEISDQCSPSKTNLRNMRRISKNTLSNAISIIG
jgi:hypothetical protein